VNKNKLEDIIMKIIVVGATGTIGKEVVKVLEGDHEIVKVAHRGGDFKVDIASTESIEKLFNNAASHICVGDPKMLWLSSCLFMGTGLWVN
jgi:dihydrodipicolinate reductase